MSDVESRNRRTLGRRDLLLLSASAGAGVALGGPAEGAPRERPGARGESAPGFDNTARCAQGTGNGPRAQALARKMATAWASFARTGNPSQPGLPWASFDPDRSPTMVFDDDCRMVDDPEAEARKILLG